jgi:hypothetical protein
MTTLPAGSTAEPAGRISAAVAPAGIAPSERAGGRPVRALLGRQQ